MGIKKLIAILAVLSFSFSAVAQDDMGGEKKPFSMVAMPNGTGDGLLICRLSELQNVVAGLLANWEEYENKGE